VKGISFKRMGVALRQGWGKNSASEWSKSVGVRCFFVWEWEGGIAKVKIKFADRDGRWGLANEIFRDAA